VSIRSILIVALALVFGGSAAVGVNTLVKRPTAPKLDTVPVVVAAADIPRGGTITADLLKTRDFPKDLVPLGAISKLQDAVDRAVYIPLVKDDPVLEGKLAPKGSGRGLAALIPKGMRAFTIQTPNVAVGVAGFVLPGNNVDVLLTVTDQGGNSETGGGSTTTLLQNVEILAVDQTMDAPAENKMNKEMRSVTILVTPQNANLLNLGQNKGTLHLALRNLEDKQDARTRPSTLADIRFHQGKPWDERAKGVLEALAKALAQRKPEAVAVANAPAPPRRIAIRPLRGTHDGAVIVQKLERRSSYGN
jgi:pilus assembly protein CpaB